MVRLLRTSLIAVAALVLIVYAGARSVSNAAVDDNPEFAATVAPGNGIAQDELVRLDLAALLRTKEHANFEPVAVRARDALRHEPLALASMVALTEQARAAGHPDVAQALLDYAGALSRRDPLVQLELIQRASATGDVQGLIRHMDEALRTTQALYGTIFPLLAQSLHDSRLVALLTPIAREDPQWYRLFIGEALTTPAALPGVRQLMLLAPNGSAARDPQLRINLINQLVATKRVDLARSYFDKLHPDAGGEIVDPEFKHPSYEAPFGWMLSEAPDLTADFVRGEGLTGYAASDREGIVARQLLSLKAGSHTVHLETTPAALGVLYVDVLCQDTGSALSVSVDRNKGAFSFVVPAGCSNQWLELGLRDGDDSRSAEASIRRVTLS
jgi:hypothetical protein